MWKKKEKRKGREQGPQGTSYPYLSLCIINFKVRFWSEDDPPEAHNSGKAQQLYSFLQLTTLELFEDCKIKRGGGVRGANRQNYANGMQMAVKLDNLHLFFTINYYSDISFLIEYIPEDIWEKWKRWGMHNYFLYFLLRRCGPIRLDIRYKIVHASLQYWKKKKITKKITIQNDVVVTLLRRINT